MIFNDPHHDLLHHQNSPVLGGNTESLEPYHYLVYKEGLRTFYIGLGGLMYEDIEKATPFDSEDDAHDYQDKLLQSTEIIEFLEVYENLETELIYE